ncbi:MAG: phosphatase PAP2 family protein [Ghiorsea sp.]
MHKTLFFLFLICFISLPQTSKAAGDIEVAGDIIQILIPSLAYGTTLYLDDEEGEIQMYKSFFSTMGITQVLKYSINKKRPNGGDHSFPSGHTSAAFQGASFIHARYGYKYAIPAYIGATFVGYSRVESNNHFTSDVLAGAMIGTACSFYFTDAYQGINISPLANHQGNGLSISANW